VIIFFKPFETNLNANYKQHQACTLIRHRRNFYKLFYQATLRIGETPQKAHRALVKTQFSARPGNPSLPLWRSASNRSLIH
jgi:hypothetical protein